MKIESVSIMKNRSITVNVKEISHPYVAIAIGFDNYIVEIWRSSRCWRTFGSYSDRISAWNILSI